MAFNQLLTPHLDQEIDFGDEDIFHPQFLLIEEQDKRYALDANLVREVLIVEQLTPLPGFEHPQIGTTTVRGQMLYRVPLKLILEHCHLNNLPTCTCLIIIAERPELNLPKFGLLVERISQLSALKASSIMPITPEDALDETKFLGKSKYNNQDVFILNHDVLLQKNGLMQAIDSLHYPNQSEALPC